MSISVIPNSSTTTSPFATIDDNNVLVLNVSAAASRGRSLVKKQAAPNIVGHDFPTLVGVKPKVVYRETAQWEPVETIVPPCKWSDIAKKEAAEQPRRVKLPIKKPTPQQEETQLRPEVAVSRPRIELEEKQRKTQEELKELVATDFPSLLARKQPATNSVPMSLSWSEAIKKPAMAPAPAVVEEEGDEKTALLPQKEMFVVRRRHVKRKLLQESECEDTSECEPIDWVSMALEQDWNRGTEEWGKPSGTWGEERTDGW